MATPIGQIPLSSSHKGHGLCELNNLIPTKKQDIQNFIDTTEQNDLVQLQEYISSSDTLLKDNTSNFQELENKLKMQTEKLKQDLDLLTAKTISLYHKMEEDNTKLIQKYQQDLNMYDKQLRQQIKECKAALQDGSHIEIYDTGCEILSRLCLPVKPVLATASFMPNKNPQHHLELALGEIATLEQGQASTEQDGSLRTSDGQTPCSTSQQTQSKVKEAVTMYNLLPQTEVLEEWESPVDITSICSTTDGQAWTSNHFSNTLTLLDRKGKEIHRVRHNTNISDISLSPTTHSLWVCDRDNNILELLLSGELKHRFWIKEEPQCICVTASNNVIVGMTNKISKFTTQGQMVLSTSAAGTGKPLVCSPWRISECPVTQNVAVIDDNKEDDGGDGLSHVIVMDTDFKKIFVYRDDIPKGDGTLCPYGVVYDRVGNIIIGDRNKNRIQLISGDGEFLRTIHTDIGWAEAIGVDREEVLWAMFVGGDIKLLQYSSI